jgi:hypothetical protein
LIGNGVTSIEENAFKDCRAMTRQATTITEQALDRGIRIGAIVSGREMDHA